MLKDYELRKNILVRLIEKPMSRAELDESFDTDISEALKVMEGVGNIIFDENTKKYSPVIYSFHDYVKKFFPSEFMLIHRSIFGESLRDLGKEYKCSAETIRTREFQVIKKVGYGKTIFKDNFYEDTVPSLVIRGDALKKAVESNLVDLLSANYYLRFFVESKDRTPLLKAVDGKFFDFPVEIQELIKEMGYYVTDKGRVYKN